MSARLGLNKKPYVSWKGQTFTQITSWIRKNKMDYSVKPNMYSARPLNIYRREIASVYNNCKGSLRTSGRVNNFEKPGGYLISNVNNQQSGIESILDKQLVKTKLQLNEYSCNNSIYSDPIYLKDIYSQNKCLSTQNNALRKVRSSGKIKQNFYSTTNQYLYNRRKTFEQNQFNYLKTGTSSALPGSASATSNTYINGGVSFTPDGRLMSCPVTYKPSNYNYNKNGAVDSSTRMNRIKYDELNNISASYKGVYGTAMENSFAGGVPSPGYNKKSIIGYSLTKVPIVMPKGEVRQCEYVRIRR